MSTENNPFPDWRKDFGERKCATCGTEARLAFKHPLTISACHLCGNSMCLSCRTIIERVFYTDFKDSYLKQHKVCPICLRQFNGWKILSGKHQGVYG